MIAHLYVSPFREGDVGLSHWLLLAAARQYADSTFDSTIAFGPFGKPYFPYAPSIHFNITHSGDYWMLPMHRSGWISNGISPVTAPAYPESSFTPQKMHSYVSKGMRIFMNYGPLRKAI